MQSSVAVQKWTDQYLDAMRQQGDPLADACFERLRTEHTLTRTSDLFRLLHANNSPLPAAAPAALQDFLDQTQALPARTARDRIKHGEDLFMAHAFLAALVLLTKSLPAGYAAPNLAQVLHLSGDLERQPYKRTLGVLQMVVNVTTRRGFEAGGEAIITAQKLRLLHAGVRHIVRQHLPEYEARYGVPVNQEDMLATLMGFSYLVIEGLRQLHANLSQAEEEDYYYLWRIYAQLMGIRPEYVPESVDDARMFYEAYARRHYVAAADNTAGVQLAAADLRMLQHMLPRLFRPPMRKGLARSAACAVPPSSTLPPGARPARHPRAADTPTDRPKP
jgi:ER-bound oxygenase mpaB/B'/Rubber oxygenase, catalytic domain